MEQAIELDNCPFCNASACAAKIGRDWYRVVAAHDEDCILNDDLYIDFPQTESGLNDLINCWQNRPSPWQKVRQDQPALNKIVFVKYDLLVLVGYRRELDGNEWWQTSEGRRVDRPNAWMPVPK